MTTHNFKLINIARAIFFMCASNLSKITGNNVRYKQHKFNTNEYIIYKQKRTKRNRKNEP